MHSCLAFVDRLRLLNSHLPSCGQASLVNLDVCAAATSSLALLSQQEISGRQRRGPGFVEGTHWKGHLIELDSKANMGSNAVQWDSGKSRPPLSSKPREWGQVSEGGVLSGRQWEERARHFYLCGWFGFFVVGAMRSGTDETAGWWHLPKPSTGNFVSCWWYPRGGWGTGQIFTTYGRHVPNVTMDLWLHQAKMRFKRTQTQEEFISIVLMAFTMFCNHHHYLFS